MAEKVSKLGIPREPGFLYFLRGSNVYKTPMKRASGPSATAKAEMVCPGNFDREDGYLYFLDAEGDISRARREVASARTATFALTLISPIDSTEATAPSRMTGIIRPPGSSLRGWLLMLFSHRTCTRVFDPVLADVQQEWLEAHKRGDTRLARWIQIRGMFILASAIIAQLPLSIIRWLWDAWKNTKMG